VNLVNVHWILRILNYQGLLVFLLVSDVHLQEAWYAPGLLHLLVHVPPPLLLHDLVVERVPDVPEAGGLLRGQRLADDLQSPDFILGGRLG
jgi:hypothetical protein